jgi:hypothetical protein
MPDSTNNFVVDAANGPIPADTVTRTEFINALQQLNYVDGNIRSIDELSGTAGIIALDGSGDANVRTITASTGLSVSNGDGSSNPNISLNDPNAFRQTYNDTSSNTVSDNKLYNIISAGTTFALPTPTAGFIAVKNVINATSGAITLTSSDFGPAGMTSVTIKSGNTITLVSDLASKWYPRTALETAQPFGAIYQTTPAGTTISGTYQSLNGITATDSNMINTDMPANGQIRYTGNITLEAEVHVSASIAKASNTQTDVLFSLFKHDAIAGSASQIASTEQQLRWAASSQMRTLSLVGHTELDTNDYVYVGIKWGAAAFGETITPSHFYMSVSGNRIVTT